MNPSERRYLQRNRVNLVTNLEAIDVIDYLQEDGVLTENDCELISNGGTRKERAQLLLNMLPTRGPEAYGLFQRALSKGKYDYLEKLLAPVNKANTRNTDESHLIVERGHNSDLETCLKIVSQCKDGVFQNFLKDHFFILIDNVEPLDIIDFFYQDEVISVDQMELVKINKTRKDRCVTFLNELTKSSSDRILKTLQNSLNKKYKYIGDRIKTTSQTVHTKYINKTQAKKLTDETTEHYMKNLGKYKQLPHCKIKEKPPGHGIISWCGHKCRPHAGGELNSSCECQHELWARDTLSSCRYERIPCENETISSCKHERIPCENETISSCKYERIPCKNEAISSCKHERIPCENETISSCQHERIPCENEAISSCKHERIPCENETISSCKNEHIPCENKAYEPCYRDTMSSCGYERIQCENETISSCKHERIPCENEAISSCKHERKLCEQIISTYVYEREPCEHYTTSSYKNQRKPCANETHSLCEYERKLCERKPNSTCEHDTVSAYKCERKPCEKEIITSCECTREPCEHKHISTHAYEREPCEHEFVDSCKYSYGPCEHETISSCYNSREPSKQETVFLCDNTRKLCEYETTALCNDTHEQSITVFDKTHEPCRYYSISSSCHIKIKECENESSKDRRNETTSLSYHSYGPFHQRTFLFDGKALTECEVTNGVNIRSIRKTKQESRLNPIIALEFTNKETKSNLPLTQKRKRRRKNTENIEKSFQIESSMSYQNGHCNVSKTYPERKIFVSNDIRSYHAGCTYFNSSGRYLMTTFNYLSTMINEGKFDEFGAFSSNLRRKHSNDFDMMYLIEYLHASRDLFKNDFASAKKHINKAFQIVPKTSYPKYFTLEMLTTKTRLYITQKKLEKLEKALDDAKMIIEMDPFGCTGRAAGWLYLNDARNCTVQIGLLNFRNPKVNTSYAKLHIRAKESFQRALSNFQKDGGKDGPFGFGYALCRLVILLLKCDENGRTMDILLPSEEDIKEAGGYLLQLADSFAENPKILKMHYSLAKCDYHFRRNSVKQALEFGEQAYGIASELQLLEFIAHANNRCIYLRTKNYQMLTQDIIEKEFTRVMLESSSDSRSD